MGGSGGAAIDIRRSIHMFAFACIPCCKNWLEGRHSHSRRHRCHTLSCFSKGYPMSHLSDLWDTEPHTLCRHQQTGSPFTGCGRHQHHMLSWNGYLQVCPFLQAAKVYVHSSVLACTGMCKLQSCSNQKQQEDEDDIVELGDSHDDIDERFDI